MYFTKFKTPLGEITIVGDATGINRLHLSVDQVKSQFSVDPSWQLNDDFFAEAKQQLTEYFDGVRKEFSLKLAPIGTDFQRKVWQQLCTIPYGKTASYKDIAVKVGNSNASRAIGMANNKNPIPIIIPCHRVIGASGKLTGYAYGLDIKQQLLRLEESNSK